ncbi:MAG: hypothetical protein OXU37_03645 [Thaumarchaeota archaeon]|nr:hypothetical protein [Nitrososphaerota archaeon]RNJ74589.1 MAG: hypothetical protein EB833_00390 [Thaumarchaeota archaeon S13]
MKQERVFQNTFAPECENHELSVGQIIVGLGFGAFKYRKLPPEVRKAVDEEMRRRVKKREAHPYVDDSKRRIKMLKAAQSAMQQSSEKGVCDAAGVGAGKKKAMAERTRQKVSGVSAPMAQA